MNLTAFFALSQPVKGIQSRHACNIHDIIALNWSIWTWLKLHTSVFRKSCWFLHKIKLATSLSRRTSFIYICKNLKINKQPPASKHIWIHKGLHTPYKADDAIVFNILRVPNRHITQVHLQIKPHESRETRLQGKELRLRTCTFCPFSYAIVMLPFLCAF